MDQPEKSYKTAHTDWLPPVLTGILMFTGSLATFYLPVYLKEQLGYSGFKIGVIFAVQAVAGVIIILPAGLGNDRITCRNLVRASLLFLAIGFILMGMVKAFWLFMGATFVHTASTHLFRMSLDVQVLKTDSGEETGKRIGLYQAFRFGGIGVGTVLAGYLLTWIDFKQTFFLSAFICLLLILPARFLPPTPVGKQKFSDYKADFSQPKILFFAIWLLLFATHWGAEFTSYGLFLRQDLALSTSKMGWYMSGEFIAIFITTLIIGKRLKGDGWLLPFTIIGLTLSGAGHIGMIFKPLEFSFAMRTLHGVGDGLIFLVFYIGIARLFKVERLGGNAGLLNLATMIGLILGALVYGPMGENWGYGAPMWISGILILALIPPIIIFSLKTRN